MLRTVEAVIDEQGNVHLLEAVQLTAARKALVTILEDAPVARRLSQNSKNAKESVIFMVVKGQLLTKFVLRYASGHATQTVSVRSDRWSMALSPTAHPTSCADRSAPGR